MDALRLSRRQAVIVVIVVVGVLAVAGRYLTQAGASTAPRAAEPVRAIATTARPRVVVHVVGAVRRPGLYRLREGSRTADAVRRAGGATARADLTLINLAAPLADGVQVVVPRKAPPVPRAGGAAGGPAAAAAAPESAGPVSLSTATAEQLDALPGIGPVTAEKILAYRDEHGAFASVDELDAVPGIGPKRLEQLRELLTP
jgi:competence protein ComEA